MNTQLFVLENIIDGLFTWDKTRSVYDTLQQYITSFPLTGCK